MPDFRSAPDGARLVLDRAEAELLRNLTSEYRALLGGGRVDRGDPVYDRLFPSAYETAEDERAYRDLVGDDLQTHKLEALGRVTSSLEATDITIDGEDFDAWVQTLTDLRLAIGTRLDVDEDRMAAEVDPHDPDTPSLQVLHWLGWIQQGLIEARGNITTQ